MIDEPMFMTNEDWYYFDFDKRKYVLTDKAPKEAVESYEEYYKEVRLIESKSGKKKQ